MLLACCTSYYSSSESYDEDEDNIKAVIRWLSYNAVQDACEVHCTEQESVNMRDFLRMFSTFDFPKEPVTSSDEDFDMDEVFCPQIGIPPPSIVFQTRAKAQLDTDQMVSLDNLEDYMNIWSRSLPYSSYDSNDEPLVQLVDAISPYWYPQVSTDASHTLDVNNSWWVTNDYVSFFSSMFLYFKGSIGMKILCQPGTGYKYLTLTSGDVLRQPGHNPFTFVTTQLPPTANFGYGTVATDLGGQPVLEVTIPLRSSLRWAFANPQQMSHVLGGFYYGLELSGSLHTNVVLHDPSADLQDALYRKAGKDFILAVRSLLPPPTLWMAKGNDWV